MAGLTRTYSGFGCLGRGAHGLGIRSVVVRIYVLVRFKEAKTNLRTLSRFHFNSRNRFRPKPNPYRNSRSGNVLCYLSSVTSFAEDLKTNP